MRPVVMSRLYPVVLAIVLTSCAKPVAPVATPAPAPEPAQAPAPLSDLDRRLLEIAKDYPSYGIVDSKFS